MRLPAAIGFGLGLLGAMASASATGCPGNPSAMGTSRVLHIDPREYPLIGTVQYQETLPLNDKEVVLTFDDGPMPPYTNRVLETLAHECVKVNYFVVGRMARGYPDLLRRIHAEGHVIGTHTENHPLAFDKMPLPGIRTEVDQGFASARGALRDPDAVAPFFRIPGLLRADAVEQYLRSRGMVTWSADVVADDWKHITAAEVVTRSIARLDAKGKGILLLHDIQPATALALPHLLRELKKRGYKIVQVAPATAPPALVASAPRPSSAASTSAMTTTVVPKQQQPVQAQPQREAWPVPHTAGTPIPGTRTEPATTVVRSEPTTVIARGEPQVVRAEPPQVVGEQRSPTAVVREPSAPDQTLPAARSAPEVPAPQVPPEAAVANASPAPAPVSEPETSATLPARAMPVPILEAARPVRPTGTTPATGATPDTQPPAPQITRPLTPGFKPSHSDAPPTKVSEMPAERQRADPWAMRAEFKPR